QACPPTMPQWPAAFGQREQSRFKFVVPFLSTLRPDREASISDGLGAEDASVTRNWNTKHPFDK
ncbi:MAG: hypothetical protein ABJJ53_12335, partial [Sulfitobacter sp.]